MPQSASPPLCGSISEGRRKDLKSKLFAELPLRG
jgi:hypothetical protein